MALALVGCTTPGGIYNGYEGPEKDPKEIAVLDWSLGYSSWLSPRLSRPKRKSGVVTEIDGKDVPGSLRLFGAETTRAHLLPGIHTITVMNNWEELELGDDTDFFLGPFLQEGRFYVVIETPCFDCGLFKVTVTIEDTATGAIVGTNVRYGIESYRSAQRRLYRECMDDCEEEGDGLCELLCIFAY